MASLITEILVLGLGMIVSPGIFALTIILLSQKKNSLKHVWAFLLGNILTLILLIFIGFFLGNALNSNPEPSLHKGLDLLVGFIFIFFGLKAVKSRDKSPKKHGERRHFFWFFIGFLGSITNADAETLFLVSMREITHLSSNFFAELLLISYISFMILLPILLPLIIYLLFPAKSRIILTKINKPVQKYGYKLVVVIFLLFGFIFLLKGFGVI